MSNKQGLGPAPKRITIKQSHVRELVSEQFPHWAHLPIRAVDNGGWDNYTFHLGDEMSIRLPSAAEYALAVEKEHRWLTVLALQLPKPIPVALAKVCLATTIRFHGQFISGLMASQRALMELLSP